MSTLKELVNETTNIKDELKLCYSNLSNALTEKGIEVSSEYKMSTLIGNINNIDSVRFGYGDTLLLTSDNFNTPLDTSNNLKRAYYNTFKVNNIFRNRVDTYTLSMNLSHSSVNRKNFTFIICDSQQTILHEINVPIFKYAIDISIDLKYLPNDNILGFYMLNETTSTGLITKCNLSCDMQFI